MSDGYPLSISAGVEYSPSASPGIRPPSIDAAAAAAAASFEIADDVCAHNKYSGHTCNRIAEPFVWDNLVWLLCVLFSSLFYFHFSRFALALKVGTDMRNSQLSLPINSRVQLVMAFFIPFRSRAISVFLPLFFARSCSLCTRSS